MNESPTRQLEGQTKDSEQTARQPTEAELVASRNGRYATADQLLENAPKDIEERDIEDVFGGLTVRVRSLTASQSAQVKQMSFNMQGRTPDVAWAAMERTQFELGVVEPKLSAEQVLMLHRTSGKSFAKVIDVLDEISGIGKEELRTAQREFQESEQPDTV